MKLKEEFKHKKLEFKEGISKDEYFYSNLTNMPHNELRSFLIN